MIIRNLYSILDSIAPFETQETFDNSGLLVGSMEQELHTILFALDVTDRVLDEASILNADLIITHHPLMFSPIKALLEEDYEGHLIRRMIRENRSLIAMHTCLDKAVGGINDTLASLLGLIEIKGYDYIRVGQLPSAMPARELSAHFSRVLNTTVRLMGDPDRTCHRLGLCSGSGSDFWSQAAAMGADAFLTGQIKHHHALAMVHAGLTAFECGHFATEEPGLFTLASTLQKHPDVVKYNLRLYNSKSGAYGAPGTSVTGG